MKYRNGIALLITLVFIIAITLSVAIGLKQVKEGSYAVQNELFLLQSNMILNDVLTFLKNSNDLKKIIDNNDSVESLNMFLSQVGFIPFESNDIMVSLEIKSARSKININTISEHNISNTEDINERKEAFNTYFSKYSVDSEYTNILLDMMGEIKEGMLYNSEIFYEKPYLFRDYIVSLKHLEVANNFYKQIYHDNYIDGIDFKNLFTFNQDKKTAVDLNYATADVWELMLDVDEIRANELLSGSGSYTKLSDLGLSDDEKLLLSRFRTSYFEPYLDVMIEIIQKEHRSKIYFEYDIKNSKGSHFSYEI